MPLEHQLPAKPLVSKIGGILLANLFPRDTAAIAVLDSPGSCTFQQKHMRGKIFGPRGSPTVSGGFSRHDERSKNTKCQSALIFVRPHRVPREYRSPCQRTATPLMLEAQRPTHQRLKSLTARTRTRSENRMARSLRGHGSDEADGRLPADTAIQSLHAWSFPQRSFGVRLGRDPTTTRSFEWESERRNWHERGRVWVAAQRDGLFRFELHSVRCS